MFPGVKTPGYSQDVPPGQRNLVAAFCGNKATRFTNDAFKTISRLGCPVWKMWDTITPTVSSGKNVGHVRLPEGEGQGEGKRRELPSRVSDHSRKCRTGRVLRQSRKFPEMTMTQGDHGINKTAARGAKQRGPTMTASRLFFGFPGRLSKHVQPRSRRLW